jgi:hypothetical protein
MSAPEGNQNAVKNRPWADALRRALLAEDGQKLRALADRLVEQALAGDVTALKEIGDRMDGKPKQQIEASGPDGTPFVVRVEALDANL